MNEQRFECLRLAVSLGGTPDVVLATAKAFFEFVTPTCGYRERPEGTPHKCLEATSG